MNELTVTHLALQLTVVIFYIALTLWGSRYYLQHIRLPRPTIGTFNGRDVIVIMIFVVLLPYLLVAISNWARTLFLILVFTGILSFGYRSVAIRRVRIPAMIILMGGPLVVRAIFGSGNAANVARWSITSLVVVLVVVAAANLNTQGGMLLRHATWFAIILGIYDSVFAWVFPLTQRLLDTVQLSTITPSAGMQFGDYTVVIGMGDLVVYGLYIATAYKAYGNLGSRVAAATILLFGGFFPVLIPYIVTLMSGHEMSLMPAQVTFGPAALAGYLLLRRRGPEGFKHTRPANPASPRHPGRIPAAQGDNVAV
jgi:hypothetical protein